jgi:hypothetical protein
MGGVLSKRSHSRAWNPILPQRLMALNPITLDTVMSHGDGGGVPVWGCVVWRPLPLGLTHNLSGGSFVALGLIRYSLTCFGSWRFEDGLYP